MTSKLQTRSHICYSHRLKPISKSSDGYANFSSKLNFFNYSYVHIVSVNKKINFHKKNCRFVVTKLVKLSDGFVTKVQ